MNRNLWEYVEARNLAHQAAALDEIKHRFTDAMEERAAKLVHEMHAFAQELAGDNAAHIYGPPETDEPAPEVQHG